MAAHQAATGALPVVSAVKTVFQPFQFRLLDLLGGRSRIAADLIDRMRCLLDRKRLRRVELELDAHAGGAHEMDIDSLIEFSAPGIAELLDAITLFGKGSHGLRHARRRQRGRRH